MALEIFSRSPLSTLTYFDEVGSLEIASLLARYRDGSVAPAEVIAAIYDRIESRGADAVWISLVPRDQAIAAAKSLPETQTGLPLYGIPFAVKDNIDVAGVPTTAACPDFAYDPAASATSVARLVAAGAIVIGKTNLDQFATGLNGTRSPHGAPSTPFDDRFISGGSSSGSAVAVAAGLVSFALGTDTAGSGRVPAALTNTVGVKPSRGLVSTAGVVPACRSLDCVTAFTLTVADGSLVLSVLAARDDADGWSRDLPVPSVIPALTSFRRKRVAVPRSDQLGFAPESEYSAAWAAVLDLLGDADAEIVELDFSEFFAVGELLYSGPWLAERLSGIEEFTTAHPDSLNPVVRELLERGAGFTGTEVFRGIDDIELARRSAARRFAAFDVVMTPTTPTTFTIEEMVADPIVRNAALGRFTTFGNLLDMAAVAVPAGFTATGMPFGVSVLGSAGTDAALLGFAGALESLFGLTLGATPFTPTDLPKSAANPEAMTVLRLAVVGAHLAGMPLNWQLAELGAVLERVTTTSKQYRLFALANTSPPKPGLVKVDVEGAAIEVEVYRVPSPRFAEFIARVGSPLAIGTISLIDGSSVHGFVCEPWGIDGANDVTRFGGWRAYIDAVNH